MKRLMFCLGLLALFLSTRPQPVFASFFTEVGEAGNLPATAQTTVGVEMLTAIEGTVISSSDQDMFQIFIADPANFSASTNNPGTSLSGDNDTQLFLFDLGGFGVLANDDDPNDPSFPVTSAIPAGSLTGPSGLYYIAISIFDNDPVSIGGEIFPDDPFNLVVGPTGPGGASPITDWISDPFPPQTGTYRIELTGTTPKPLQRIFLDWDNPVSVDFFPSTTSEGDELINWTSGTEPISNTTQSFQNDVLNNVQSIFDASGIEPGIDIDIVDSRAEALESNDLVVRFAPFDANLGLLGIAFDTAPTGSSSPIDRFNLRADGEVAVFIRNSDTAKSIAETVAHEGGHGLGLRHINPFKGNGIEVMDYADVPDTVIEEFTNKVSFIFEKPIDNNKTPDSVLTHNPRFHLRRYVVGDEPAELLGDGVFPGSWDLETFDIVSLGLAAISFPESIFNLKAMIDLGGGSLLSEPLEPDLFQVAFFDVVDPTNLLGLDFFVSSEFPLRIFGSSAPDRDLDLFFGFGDASNPDLLFDDLSVGNLTGNIFQFSTGTDTFEVVGDFSAQVNAAFSVSPDGIEPIPEPSTLALFGIGTLGMFSVAWWRKRR